MLSAPAHIPAIRVASLGTGLAAPDLILDSTMRTFSPSNSARSVCSASVITGTSPAHDTRLSSSNTAESGVNLCDTCTESAFLCRSDCCCWNSNHPSSEGTFLIKTPAPSSIKLGGSRFRPVGAATRLGVPTGGVTQSIDWLNQSSMTIREDGQSTPGPQRVP